MPTQPQAQSPTADLSDLDPREVARSLALALKMGLASTSSMETLAQARAVLARLKSRALRATSASRAASHDLENVLLGSGSDLFASDLSVASQASEASARLAEKARSDLSASLALAQALAPSFPTSET